MSTATATRTFGAELSRRVEERLDPESLRIAHGRVHRKALVMVAWFIVSYVGVLLASTWAWGALACVSLALAIAGVGFNIQHDANHNALFATRGSKRMTVANRLAGLSIHVSSASLVASGSVTCSAIIPGAENPSSQPAARAASANGASV